MHSQTESSRILSNSLDGISALWPEASHQFLSLQSISELKSLNSTYITYKQLLTGFDSLTSCEFKAFYRFAIFLQQLEAVEKSRPQLELVVKAFQAWVRFDYYQARVLFRQHLEQYPCDVVTLFFIHMLDFNTGNTSALLPEIDLCNKFLSESHYLYSFFLAIKSFTYCESALQCAALPLGMASLQCNHHNVYGIHAVAHSLHELGRWQELCAFLQQHKEHWVNNDGMRMHVCWHLAIAYERCGQPEQSVRIFNEMYSLKDSPFAKQDLDAVAFLWRYRLLHPNDRQFDATWRQLAWLWSGCIGSSVSYFHSIHAALAFAASDQPILIEKLISESDGFGLDDATHCTGTTILQAILNFATGRYNDCLRKLLATQDRWHKLGGSRAQRELLILTLEATERLLASQGSIEDQRVIN